MIDHVERRFFSAILAFLLLICILPVEVFAAETVTPIDGKLTVKSTQKAALQDGVVTVTAEAGHDTCNNAYEGANVTVTITNISSTDATVSFKYTDANNINGAITVKGATDNNGAVSGTIKANGTITLKFKGVDRDATASLKLSDFTFVEKQTVNVTLKVPVNGSYTVAGAAVTAESTIVVDTTEGVAVAATAAEGYNFVGWYNELTGKYLSFKATDSLYFTEATSLVPKFSTVTDADFAINDARFVSLDEALAVATPGSVIVPLRDVTLTKNYTIPATITLLIPYDDGWTVSGSDPTVVEIPTGTTTPTCSLFRKLTLAENVTIAVKGNLELGAKHYASHGGTTIGGTPVTGYGQIEMNANSSIILETGANLYAWGYITGLGTVHAKTGATVYEKMQVSDYRGGNITSQIICCNVFPFNQYYIQNVEVKETFDVGASLVGHAGIYASSLEKSTVKFMGANTSMFNISSGSATKYYDANNDRLVIDVNGSISMNAISVMGYDTSEYILPLNHNMTINIREGHTATIAQDVMLLPGATINVDEGATLTLSSGKKAYLMDTSDWGNYCFGKKLEPISYVPALGKTPGIRTADNMTDAKINVNGNLVANGSLYATNSGAQIVSGNESGKIMFEAAPPTDTPTIYQSHVGNHQNNWHEGGVSGIIGGVFGDTHKNASKNTNLTGFTVAPAVLTNGAGADPATVSTSGFAAGTEVHYCAECDKWVETMTLSFDANGGEGEMESMKVHAGGEEHKFPLPEVTFTAPEGKVFAGWNTVANPTEEEPGTAYGDKYELYDFTGDITLYAQWGLKGDVDLDGDVDFEDAVMLTRHYMDVEIIENEMALANADVDGDSEITLNDAVKLTRFALDVDSEL